MVSIARPVETIGSANTSQSFVSGGVLALQNSGADIRSEYKAARPHRSTWVVYRALLIQPGGKSMRILFVIVVLAAALVVPSSLASAQTGKARGAAKTGSATKARATPASPVNLNSASAAQLQTLPGIGASTAQRIVDYRQKNGNFKKIEELMNVKGIGEKSFLKLKPLITVGPDKGEHAAGDK